MIIIREIARFKNYLINEYGQIFHKKRPDKPISQWVDNTGYWQVALYEDGKRYYARVHRLVADAYVDNPDNLQQVNHIDGDKLNVEACNLEWVTNSQNTQHGYDNKLYKTTKRKLGVKVLSKETNEVLFEFESIRQLSETLELNRKTVSNILNGSKKTNNYPYDFEYS